MRVVLESEEPADPRSLLRLTVNSLVVGEHLTSLQAHVAIAWALETLARSNCDRAPLAAYCGATPLRPVRPINRLGFGDFNPGARVG